MVIPILINVLFHLNIMDRRGIVVEHQTLNHEVLGSIPTVLCP